jgi:membrane protein
MQRFHMPPPLLESPKRSVAFAKFLWKRFWDDNCFEAAGALSYTTLFALVPLGAVGLAIVSAFDAFEAVKSRALEFIFQQFVPSAGTEVLGQLNNFFEKASHLSVPGVIALIVSAILMMNSIEDAFSRIWRVPVKRTPVARFLVFWTALTLGPLLIAGSLALSAYVLSLPFISETANQFGLQERLLVILPFFITFVGFTLSYMIVPNRPVRWRHAALGGVLATLLFEVAKLIFAWYLRTFPATQQVYGGLSSIPIFILWIYILWLIALLGASVASSLGAFRFDEKVRPILPEEILPMALRVLGQLRFAQLHGRGMSSGDIKARVEGLTEELLSGFLSDFDALQLTTRSEFGTWMLARDLNAVTLLDLYRTGHYPLPTKNPELKVAASWEQALSKTTCKLSEQTRDALNLSLAQAIGLKREVGFEVTPLPESRTPTKPN